MCFPIYSPKGDSTAESTNQGHESHSLLQCSLLLLQPPDPLQHLESCPTETRTAKHLFGCLCPFPALGMGPQMTLCWVWMQWDSVLWVWGWCWDHSLLLRLPQLVPGVLPGASLDLIRILWEYFSKGFVKLLWKRSSPAPCTAQQHCYTHRMGAHTPHMGSVQQSRSAWIPLGFQYSISTALCFEVFC